MGPRARAGSETEAMTDISKTPSMLGRVGAVLWLLGAGCGGPGSLQGTVGGKPVQVKDAVFLVQGQSSYLPGAVVVVLSDQPGLCEAVRNGHWPRESTLVQLVLARKETTGQWGEVGTGPYAVIPSVTSLDKASGAIAAGYVVRHDSACANELSAAQAAMHSGTVKVESYANGTFAGSLDLSVGAQRDQLGGHFAARYCELETLPAPTTCE